MSDSSLQNKDPLAAFLDILKANPAQLANFQLPENQIGTSILKDPS